MDPYWRCKFLNANSSVHSPMDTPESRSRCEVQCAIKKAMHSCRRGSGEYHVDSFE